MFYEQTQTYRIDTLKLNMELDLSFKSKEKCLYFYVFLENVVYIHPYFCSFFKEDFVGFFNFMLLHYTLY